MISKNYVRHIFFVSLLAAGAVTDNVKALSCNLDTKEGLLQAFNLTQGLSTRATTAIQKIKNIFCLPGKITIEQCLPLAFHKQELPELGKHYDRHYNEGTITGNNAKLLTDILRDLPKINITQMQLIVGIIDKMNQLKGQS